MRLDKTQRTHRCGKLISDSEWKRQNSIFCFLCEPARARLFKQNTHCALNVRECGTLSVIEVIVIFLGIVQRSNPIKCAGVKFTHLSCQFDVASWCKRMRARRNTGLEEERVMASHF